MAPVGSVPAASPSTYIDSGTVASEISGARLAPTIEPVAKITAEFAPVSACAAPSRATLARARASLAVSSVAVRSIIEAVSAPACRATGLINIDHYEASHMLDQPTQTGAGYASRSGRRRSSKYQSQIVGRHLRTPGQRQTGGVRELLQIGDVAYAPFGISFAQAGVECCIAGRNVLAVPLERAIQEQSSIGPQIPPGAGKQSFCHPPRRDVDDIGAEHPQQFSGAAALMQFGTPRRI